MAVLAINTYSELEADLRALKEAQKRYYGQHVSCPTCSSPHQPSSHVGYIMMNASGRVREYQDTNRAACGCGWSGRVHDLKPEGRHV